MSTPDMYLDRQAVPRWQPGVRLHRDQTRGRWVILAPERVIELDCIAHAIVRLFDGERSIATIVDELANDFDAPFEQVSCDVQALIDDLVGKRVMRL